MKCRSNVGGGLDALDWLGGLGWLLLGLRLEYCGRRRRDDARARLALTGLAGLDLRLAGWAGLRAGHSVGGFGGGRWRGQGQEFLIEGDGAGDGAGGHANDGAEGIAGFAGDGEDLETALLACRNRR